MHRIIEDHHFEIGDLTSERMVVIRDQILQTHLWLHRRCFFCCRGLALDPVFRTGVLSAAPVAPARSSPPDDVGPPLARIGEAPLEEVAGRNTASFPLSPGEDSAPR